MNPFFNSKAPIALACSAMISASTALAQSNFAGLEEVIVTASKRAETLLEAGMSVTAITELELERAGVDSYMEFAVRIPNLSQAFEADGRFDSNSPTIRGVFGKDTTGFYIDDTPVNASVMPRVMDVERIEVLRGPQGSLYGARSMGGTIRMITKQPDFEEQSGTIHSSVSTVADGDQNYQLDGSINIPVSDTFALRLAGYFGANSGIYDDVYRPTWVNAVTGATVQNIGPAFDKQENVDDEDYVGVQITAKIMLTDTLSFTPKIIYQKIEADGLPFADIDEESTTRERFYDFDESGSDEWTLYSGTFNWELESGNVVSSTSFFDRESDESEEETHFLHFLFNNVIGIPLDPLKSELSTVEKYEFLAHETRFTSSFNGAWNFTAGIFYQDTEFDHEYPAALQPGLNDALDAIGGPGFAVGAFGLVPTDLIFTTKTITETREIAVFGEVTFDINEVWSITAGGRWWDTELDAVNASDGFANGGPTSFDVSQNDSGFNPKVLIQADLSDNLNIYASGGKGFRVGGPNGNISQTLCGDEIAALGLDPSTVETYDSDELWSYEFGVKSKLADNTVSINAAVFFIEWTDIQAQNRFACGFQFVDNTGEAESQGFEVEIQAAPTEGLTLSLGIGYTDAEITDVGDALGLSNGDPIQGVADWTGSGSAQYIFPINDGMEAILRADANYYGESYSTNNASNFADARLRPSWNALNLRGGVLTEKWDVIIYADNVTDERANLADNRSIAAETPGRPRIVTNRPRTIGIEGRFRF